VERLVQPHGGLRRGQVDEAVAHIALVAAIFSFLFFTFLHKKKPSVRQSTTNFSFHARARNSEWYGMDEQHLETFRATITKKKALA
jgi:hypothetical protein